MDLTPYLGGPRIFKFTFYSAETSGQSFFGGNLYMDNICFSGELDPASGIDAADDLVEKVTIYPNPSQETLNIASESAVNSLTIYTSTGRIVNVYTNTNRVNLSKIERGSYFIVVKTEKSIQTFNLIKK